MEKTKCQIVYSKSDRTQSRSHRRVRHRPDRRLLHYAVSASNLHPVATIPRSQMSSVKKVALALKTMCITIGVSSEPVVE